MRSAGRYEGPRGLFEGCSRAQRHGKVAVADRSDAGRRSRRICAVHRSRRARRLCLARPFHGEAASVARGKVQLRRRRQLPVHVEWALPDRRARRSRDAASRTRCHRDPLSDVDPSANSRLPQHHPVYGEFDRHCDGRGPAKNRHKRHGSDGRPPSRDCPRSYQLGLASSCRRGSIAPLSRIGPTRFKIASMSSLSIRYQDRGVAKWWAAPRSVRS